MNSNRDQADDDNDQRERESENEVSDFKTDSKRSKATQSKVGYLGDLLCVFSPVFVHSFQFPYLSSFHEVGVNLT